MVRYVKCPRCDLNYIDEEKQDYCDVCIAEMHGSKLQFADLDDEELEAVDEEIEQTEICSVCGVNPVRFGEKVCESCKLKSGYDEEEVDMDKDEEWKNYIDDDEDADLTIDDETLQEELDAELEEEEESADNDDDFFDDDLDSLSELEDDEFDDDDDDLDDDDDDF